MARSRMVGKRRKIPGRYKPVRFWVPLKDGIPQPARVSSWIIEGPETLLEDRGLLHGLGLFETMLVVNGTIVFADAHGARMAASCERLGIAPPDWRRAITELEARAQNFDQKLLRARVTRTGGMGGLNRLEGEDSATLISLNPAGPIPESAKVITAPWTLDVRSPVAGLKTTSYAANLVSLAFARERGVDELLFANSKGHWVEASISNGFLVVDGTLVTPSLESGCLPGITRALLLDAARAQGMTIDERPVGMGELDDADEVFLTSSMRGVVPVNEINGRNLEIGSMTRALRSEWRRLVGLDV